jgi:hypothetical protein
MTVCTSDIRRCRGSTPLSDTAATARSPPVKVAPRKKERAEGIFPSRFLNGSSSQNRLEVDLAKTVIVSLALGASPPQKAARVVLLKGGGPVRKRKTLSDSALLVAHGDIRRRGPSSPLTERQDQTVLPGSRSAKTTRPALSTSSIFCSPSRAPAWTRPRIWPIRMRARRSGAKVCGG